MQNQSFEDKLVAAIRSISNTLETIETSRGSRIKSPREDLDDRVKEQREESGTRQQLSHLEEQNRLLRNQNRIYFWLLIVTILWLIISNLVTVFFR
ncbi:hypothetical protein A3A49_02090 [Candidatus Curtissbacteria bacterium RIFCSPLOWO2_01_FULL_38_11b]|uniref:Uncharacterized protein n=1 Tax=Candidatus Curtissbacteria bacterium RIFCSPLOWO2_01_FULL_38_11b TaxID=1797725 RepID=A0A1F5H1F4_9BACT|nr:MAG: hypothetical protein A3A49_02090 [Candidatus Curtissbacteria bacterium RIFCSPLOWO2_01_FULL_38_11b]